MSSISSKPRGYNCRTSPVAVTAVAHVQNSIPTLPTVATNHGYISQWYQGGAALWNSENGILRPGDILDQEMMIVWHNFIFLGVFDNTPYVLSRYSDGAPTSPREAMQRALDVFNEQTRYNLCTNNCCHTVNRIRSDRATCNANKRGWRTKLNRPRPNVVTHGTYP
ncbi:hypothetical protein Ddc_13840 [Ditylenchus destructor]|nr:hypothetical protein Ddc_13840 [Ditylenchus destructor]